MAVPTCELVCHSQSAHLQQLYTGFRMLHAQRVIRLSQRLVTSRTITYAENSPHLAKAGHAHLDAVVAGDVRLHFDTHDAAEISIEALDACDYYFKRSYSRAHIDALTPARRAKIHPLGLNYRVYPDIPDHFAAARSLVLDRGLRGRLGGAARSLKLPGRAAWLPRLSEMEAGPIEQEAPRVLFLAAAHDPHNDPDRGADKVAERRTLNDMRAECIRRLRKALGDRFLGGLKRDGFTLEHYPDVLAPDAKTTLPGSYIARVKRHSICIATTGLHGSTGWKLAEYVACSRAVLTEPLRYQVPGEFSVGRNYLEFTSPEECASKARELIEDGQLRRRLMANNADYYRDFMRPDRLVNRCLQVCLTDAGAHRDMEVGDVAVVRDIIR